MILEQAFYQMFEDEDEKKILCVVLRMAGGAAGIHL
jgi:hypothetical protein